MITKQKVYDRLESFNLSNQQKEQVYNLITEVGVAGGGDINNTNQVKVTIVIGNAGNVTDVIVNDKQFTIENYVITDSGDGFIIYNAELVDYLNQINKVNIITINDEVPIDCIPLAYIYTSNRIDVIITGTLFEKSTWGFRFTKP